MLNLEKSKLRKQILQLYFFHPENKYYIRQLEKMLEKPASYVRRELLNLEKKGLFHSEFQGRERYFSLNTKHPLYKELAIIISKTIGAENLLKKKLTKIKNIETALIFGSFAAGKSDELSDIDILVIGNPDEYELIKAVSELEKKFDREINYNIFSEAEIQSRLRQKDSFISSIFTHPKIFLIGNEEAIPKTKRKQSDKKGKH